MTVAQARIGLVIGRDGSFLKEIREKAKVSSLTIPKEEGKRSVGEIHLQGKGKNVEKAFFMIVKKLKGRQGPGIAVGWADPGSVWRPRPC